MKQEKKNKKDKSIYVIVMIGDDCCISNRSVVYTCTIEEAQNYVTTNRSDLHECYYNYALIEEICSGIFRRVTKEYWYKWNTENKCYDICDRPKVYRGVTNFGLG